MPTIKNMSYGALTIQRDAADALTIEAGGTVEVEESDLDTEEVRRLVKEKKIEVKKDKQHDKK